MSKSLYRVLRKPDGNTELKLDLHPGQVKAWHSRARFVAILAGTQSGKSSFLPWLLHREIAEQAHVNNGLPHDYLAVTANYDLFKLKFLPLLKDVFEGATNSGRYWSSNRVIELKNPVTGKFEASKADDQMWGRIILRSADAGTGLESSTARAALLDEAGMDTFQLDTWGAILRRLSLSQGRVFIGTTIYNLGWLKSEIYDKWRNGDKSIDVIQFDSTANPAFPAVEFERARESMPLWKFDMFYRGLFTRPAGQIYDNFDTDLHRTVRFTIPSSWRRWVGLDFGGVNTAAVYLAEEPKTGKFYLYRIYKEGSKTAEQHTASILAGEPGIPIVAGGTKSEEQWRNEFRQSGLPIQSPSVWDVEVGIDRVYKAFAESKIIVFSDLQPFIDEVMSYSRVVDSLGEPTQKIDDKSKFHFLDALRYIVSKIQEPNVSTTGYVGDSRQSYATAITGSAIPLLHRQLPKIPGFRV